MGMGKDKISSVEKTVEDKSSVRDDCNLFREMCHRDQKAKRKLTATQVTEKCQDDYMRMQKQNTKKQRPKHVKTTKKSLFNITRLREVLSDDKDIPQNDTGALPSHGTKQAEKLNTFVNKEPKSLKDRMQEQLKSARFRYLNEQLYSGSGALAYKLFKNDEDSFRVYHEGFQSQVSKWPDNPLDRIIQYVRESRSSSVVADFGCGDAKLGESVPQKVFSFDLVALKPHVTACDMAHVPLKAGTVDICVFCLSLMGTNLLDYLLEAHRVLKLEGMLLIAEVISRFENISSFIRKLEKLGFILINKDTTSKMFVFFELKKKANYDKTMLPEITLEPCVYKKR
ncbi:hypothetical protein LSH36_108g07042 [Paralvinella palmiformis]|uniref:Ribosomal RNA-processing protein 8 n=1 Tax=Paralvinella palmiformis TaxID=53620 RepID=A0AAD9N9C6_9ANNE|nr:hypothetical protein LSH36_108g07042 [Paralvinella palmiformis]